MHPVRVSSKTLPNALAAMDNFHRTLKVRMLGSSGIDIEAKAYFDEASAAINGVLAANKGFSAIAGAMLAQRIAAQTRQFALHSRRRRLPNPWCQDLHYQWDSRGPHLRGCQDCARNEE